MRTTVQRRNWLVSRGAVYVFRELACRKNSNEGGLELARPSRGVQGNMIFAAKLRGRS